MIYTSIQMITNDRLSTSIKVPLATVGLQSPILNFTDSCQGQYCWWGRYDMGAPYYGAYFATLTLAGSSQIAPLDSGTTNYAGYAIFSGNTVTKVLLYNSDYYTGSGTRSTQIYVVSGLSGNSVTAIRLTAAAATSRQDQGQDPTIGGQTFTNGNCVISGAPVRETAGVMDGVATFTLAASEALLVYTS